MSFSPNLQLSLKESESDNTKPVLEDWQVYMKLKGCKKPTSTIPGDLPIKLIKELSPELSKPVAQIFNKITQSGIYPRQWVVEYQIFIPKGLLLLKMILETLQELLS